MPNQNKIAPIKERSRPYMDSYEPGKAIPKAPYGGNLVKPEDRVARVSADAPMIDTPDTSGNYSIFDK